MDFIEFNRDATRLERAVQWLRGVKKYSTWVNNTLTQLQDVQHRDNTITIKEIQFPQSIEKIILKLSKILKISFPLFKQQTTLYYNLQYPQLPQHLP